MIPGSEELVRRHPWTGVVLGLIGLALMCTIMAAFAAEALRHGGDRGPERIEFDRLDFRLRGSRWIELRGGTWHWDEAIERPRQLPERWLFGRVETTEVPVTDASGRRLVIAMFDGVPRRADVAANARRGVIAAESERTWGGVPSRRSMARSHDGPVLVFHPGAGPAQAWRYVAMAGTFAIFFAAFTAYWWRQRRERGESLQRAA